MSQTYRLVVYWRNGSIRVYQDSEALLLAPLFAEYPPRAQGWESLGNVASYVIHE